MDNLEDQNLINSKNGFYFLGSSDSKVKLRVARNQNVDKYRSIARKKARLIFSFPFVRGVFISGSLSKDCVESDGDIDFFILTQKNRLWLCRALLILYKKIFLLNSYRYFCLNYFIDEENLEIEEKNIYTATELVTLIPAAGKEMCEAFMDANLWTESYRPGFPRRAFLDKNDKRKLHLKKIIEIVFKGNVGDVLNEKMMKTFVRFWKRKFRYFSKEEFDDALKSNVHVSKHHPNDFQQKVLNAFERKILEFEKTNRMSLS